MGTDEAATREPSRAEYARLIEGLECARARPTMFIGSLEVREAVAWIHGFHLAVFSLFGWPPGDLEARRRAVEERGWPISANYPLAEMAERAMGPAEVVDELLAIEVERLRLLMSRGDPPAVPPDRPAIG